jgi:hypothetical protein
MRAVWSLWTKPMQADLSLQTWPSLRAQLMSWVVSLDTCRQFFPETALVTDSLGAKLLVDGLGLDFDGVSTELDALSDHAPQHWALGKLYAYRLQTEPFIHIDNDLYLWQDLPAALHTAPVLAAYPEYSGFGFQAYNIAAMKVQIARAGGWLPPELDSHRTDRKGLRSWNCCIVGGQRADFLSFYANQAIRLIEDPANAAVMQRRRDILDDMLVIEQHMLAACVDHHGAVRGGPFEGLRVSHLFNGEDDARENAGRRGFTHLIGSLKRNADVLNRLEQRVKRDYPTIYERCLALDGAGLKALGG